jgi:hypothetical protein
MEKGREGVEQSLRCHFFPQNYTSRHSSEVLSGGQAAFRDFFSGDKDLSGVAQNSSPYRGIS